MGLELHRLGGHGGGGERLRVALHLQIHPDLEELERGQLSHRLGAGLGGERLQGPVQPETGVGLGGNREPQVELMVAQIVVRDPGVSVDHLRCAMRVLGVNLGGDQHRGEAESARVEDRGDLADDALVEQVLYSRQHLVFVDPGELGHPPVGERLDREAALHQVEQAPVEVIERYRRTVLAAPGLGDRPPRGRVCSYAVCESHWATSLEW